MRRLDESSGPPSTMPPPMTASIDDVSFHDEDTFPEESPEMAQRRRKLARWVGAVVAVCSAVCLAAMVRAGVSKMGSHEDASAIVVASAPMPLVAPQQQLPVAAAAPVPAKDDGARAVPVKAKSAREERTASRLALESGRPKDAIAAGERATALDATEANAWLVLGAAYQEVGDAKSARAAFLSCSKKARRGPIKECRAMLR